MTADDLHGRLTIAHVDAEMGFSGGEVQVFLLLEGLRTAGHENVLFCRPGSRAGEEATRRGIRTVAVPMRNHLDLGTVRRLRRGYQEVGADLVHTNTGRDAWLGGWAAHRAHLPSVTTRRMDRRVKRGVRTRLTYETFASRVAAISPGVVDCLEAGGVNPERIVLITEATDPDRIRARRDRRAVRQALDVAEDEVLLLGLGALVRRKGFDVLVEAVARLDPALRSRVAVRIGGAGEEGGALRAQAEEHGLGETIRLLGPRDDVGDLLAAADVFVMPSRREGLGVASLEAMGAGRPVVASRAGGLAYVVTDGEAGVLVPPEDVDAFASALARLVRDPDLRDRLGRGARANVEARFLPETMVARYTALYREILGRWEGPAASDALDALEARL